MFRLWIEWNYGQDNYIFESEKDARQWFETYVDLNGPEVFDTHQQIFDQGLAKIEELTVWDPNEFNLQTLSCLGS